ncbi:MAG: hypothetical protein H0T47_24535 [Planctomycetaceae bacterium]|nr:hypothetical protein [Planctomycetaceae bacterium]
MTRIDVLRESRLRRTIAALLLALLAPETLPGQDAVEAVAEEAEEALVDGVNNVNMILLNPEQVAHWVFGNQNMIQRGGIQSYRGTIADGLRLQLDLIETTTSLTEPQRTKLELAGRGDVDRFMDRYEAFARECPGGAVTQDKYVELNRKAQPLARRYRAGLHGEGSLFRKVLRSTLEAEQLARVEASQAERNRMRYQTLVKATVAMIDQKIPLTADQRKRLIDVTMSETTPPDAVVEGHYKYYAVLFQMSQIREDRIQPIFADDEWPAFKVLMQQGQMARGMIFRAGAGEFDE